MDLIDYFRGRVSRRKLLNLIGMLPAWSLTVEARVNDDEMAPSMLAAVKKDTPDTGPRISEYTPLVERLDGVTDRLDHLTATVVAVMGGKPGRLRPATRPSTAITRAQKAQKDRRHDDLVAEVEQAQQRWQAPKTK